MILKKVNGKDKFLYRQNRCLSYPLKKCYATIFLCNHLLNLHLAPGIQICQYHRKLGHRQLKILVLGIAWG